MNDQERAVIQHMRKLLNRCICMGSDGHRNWLEYERLHVKPLLSAKAEVKKASFRPHMKPGIQASEQECNCCHKPKSRCICCDI